MCGGERRQGALFISRTPVLVLLINRGTLYPLLARGDSEDFLASQKYLYALRDPMQGDDMSPLSFPPMADGEMRVKLRQGGGVAQGRQVATRTPDVNREAEGKCAGINAYQGHTDRRLDQRPGEGGQMAAPTEEAGLTSGRPLDHARLKLADPVQYHALNILKIERAVMLIMLCIATAALFYLGCSIGTDRGGSPEHSGGVDRTCLLSPRVEINEPSNCIHYCAADAWVGELIGSPGAAACTFSFSPAGATDEGPTQVVRTSGQ